MNSQATFANNQLRTHIHINAAPKRVWAILTDFSAYADWNPFVKRVTGAVAEGNTIGVLLTPVRGRAMDMKPRVRAFVPERAFIWRGQLGIPGIFDGEHSFTLEPQADGSTVLHHNEQFSGLLVPLMRKMLRTSILESFVALNQALKARAESSAS